MFFNVASMCCRCFVFVFSMCFYVFLCMFNVFLGVSMLCSLCFSMSVLCFGSMLFLRVFCVC